MWVWCVQVDRVEVLYTRFINLITSEPAIRTILPDRKSVV